MKEEALILNSEASKHIHDVNESYGSRSQLPSEKRYADTPAGDLKKS